MANKNILENREVDKYSKKSQNTIRGVNKLFESLAAVQAHRLRFRYVMVQKRVATLAFTF